MARGDRDRDRDRRRTPKDLNRRGKKRVCIFCKDRIAWVDYKDVNLLRRFISDRGKIRARRVSGNCAQHQREVAVAVKTAREMALLPYAQRTVSERSGPRGGGRSSEHSAPSAPPSAGGVPPPPPPRPPRPTDVAGAPGAEPGEGSEAPLDAVSPVATAEPVDAVAAAGASDIEQ